MSELKQSLDETIASAVKAQIAAAVTAALAGDQMIGRMVEAALQRPVEVAKQGGGYGKVSVPYYQHILEEAIRDATKEAVREQIAAVAPEIVKAVSKRLRSEVVNIADAFTAELVNKTTSPYGVSVDLAVKWPTNRG